jgi:hypothetical protein
MKSTAAAARKQAVSDAPRIDLTKKLPYGPGRLKPADIKRAVSAVVNGRLAAERAAKTLK